MSRGFVDVPAEAIENFLVARGFRMKRARVKELAESRGRPAKLEEIQELACAWFVLDEIDRHCARVIDRSELQGPPKEGGG